MIFVDTWAWVSLAVKQDSHHEAVKKIHAQLVRDGRLYVTSDFVLSEVITHLYRVVPAGAAEKFVTSLLDATAAGSYRLLHLTDEQFQRAWLLRRRYRDKPDISFVDFTSMVVMQNLGITDVFTHDAHFLHVGLGFRLVDAT